MRITPAGALLLAAVCCAAALIGAGSASASITIGQTAPLNPPATCSGGTSEVVQPTVTSGRSYVVPVVGTITTWSHSAYNGPGQQITLKVWRKTAGNTYRVIGHDGPRTPVAGVDNTFFNNISIPVQPGDVLGLNRGSAASACLFSAAGETSLFNGSVNTPDNGTATFSPLSNYRVNVSAVVQPSNAFTTGAITRNKKRGTATVSITVPNPGTLVVTGGGVKPVSLSGTGAIDVPIVAGNKKNGRRLRSTGKVTIKPTITYTPNAGISRTGHLTVTLRKKIT